MEDFCERLITIKNHLEIAISTLQDSREFFKAKEIKDCDLALSRYPVKTALKKIDALCALGTERKNVKVAEETEEPQDIAGDEDSLDDVPTPNTSVLAQDEPQQDVPVTGEEETGSVSDALESDVLFAVSHSSENSKFSASSPVDTDVLLKKGDDVIVVLPCEQNESLEEEASNDVVTWEQRTDDALIKKRRRTDRSEKQCPVCKEIFIFQSKLDTHIKDIHAGNTDASERSTKDAIGFKCSHCAETFATKNKRTAHERLHTLPHCCEVCGDRFPSRTLLVKHACKSEKENQRSHEALLEEKPFSCPVCGKTFKQYFQLKYHLSQHSGEKPYQCDVCNKTFMNQRNLRDHSSIHTGEKPFKCEWCDLTFRTKSMQRQHEAVHTKPFRCKYCTASFTKVSACNNHVIRTHGSKNIADQLENVKANLSAQSTQVPSEQASIPADSQQESRGLSAEEEHTIIVNIEDHTGEPLLQEQTKTKSESGPEAKALELSSKGKTIAEADAVLAVEVDGKQMAVFKCAICDQLYPTLQLLEEHEKTHIGVGKEKSFHCEKCGKVFSSAVSFTAHQNKHEGKTPFSCSTCDKAFTSKTTLKSHEKLHTLPHNCSECDARFSSRALLLKHLQKDHGLEEADIQGGTPGSWPCSVCQTFFPFRSQLKNHMLIHTDEKPFACLFCGKSFKGKKALHDHERKHTGEKPFSCESCGKSFVNQGQLHAHKATHTKAFMCQYCSKRFAIKYQWKVHELQHVHGKIHKCFECNKSYGTRSLLRQHMQKHRIDKKVFPCKECPSVLGSKQALLIHMRIHRGEKPFQCKHCGRSFPQLCGLTAHARTHTGETPYQCDQCDKAFNAQNTLKIHKMVHSGQRDHICEECGRGFLTKTLKERHKVTHSSTKNFACTTCGRAYYTVHALNRHIRKTHNPPTQPAIQGGTTVALTDVNNLSWQQLQVLQAAGEESLKGAAGTQVKVIPAAGVMNLPVAAPEDATAPEVSFIETGSQQDGATEIQYIQQDVGGTQTLVETPHDVDMSDVQTIMVELPYGQELDANSIVSLLQQHQQ